MADARFFRNVGATDLRALAELTDSVLASVSGAIPDPALRIADVAPLDRAGASDISFLDNIKYVDQFAASKAGACFVRPKFVERAPQNMALLVTDDPYTAYALTAQYFYPDAQYGGGVSPQAVVAKDAALGRDTRIDAGAVIGSNVRLGDGCWIGSNTVIGDGVEIGAHSRIGANCTVSHAVIGERALLHRGIHIGQDGFGFAPGKKGLLKVPQLGRVIIGNDVEIGSGTCIDRGAGPDTLIGNGCKIDNLVQIGHNVQLGNHVVIAAQVGIAGSTKIGDGVMLGGQAGLAGHLSIGAGAKLAAQAGVMTDVPAGATYGGSPAVPGRDWHRQNIVLSKLATRKEGNE